MPENILSMEIDRKGLFLSYLLMISMILFTNKPPVWDLIL